MFLSIELLALISYCLVASGKTVKSIEASIKYFAVGAISTSFLLFGIWLIYFSNETTTFLHSSATETQALHALTVFIFIRFY